MGRKAEEILDRCIERMRSGGNPEDILRENPQEAEEIRPLLALVTELEALPDVTPSLGRMMKLAVRLTSRQQVERKSSKRRVKAFSSPVFFKVAAILMCVLLVGWGTSAASSKTLPGDVLYPVKLLTERVKFFLTFDHEDKIELRIVFSEKRLKEVVKKYQKGHGIDKDLLKTMLDEARAAVEGVSDLSTDKRDLLVARVLYLSEFQRHTLENLKLNARPEEREELATYVQRCQDHCTTASRMISIAVNGAGADDRFSENLSPAPIDCPLCGHPKDHEDDTK